MRIFLAGISCVGKSTIGPELADLLNCSFFDLDDEIEKYFSTPIERLMDKFLGMHSFRKEASKALKHILDQQESLESVIALAPSGLMDSYWRLVKKSNGITVVLTDYAENILERIIFTDKDSKPIKKILSPKERSYYLKEIYKHITYYNRSYKRADMTVHISGLKPDQAALKIKNTLQNYQLKISENLKEGKVD